MSAPLPVVEAVRGARDVLIATHSPMDGDGAGSGLALLRVLEDMGKRVRFVTEHPVPRAYRWLPGAGSIEVLGDDPVPPADLVIALDAGDERRLGRVHDERGEGAVLLNIDHHVSNTGYGDISWVDPLSAATGEQVFGLILALGAHLHAEAALCLLVALVTDTGRFSYSNTTARTLAVASELVDRGADPDRIQRELYASTPIAVVRLRAEAASRLQLVSEGRVSMLVLPHDFGTPLGVDREDVKDLVDLGITVEGVLVTALIYGRPEGGCKVSLRSKDDRADVATLATGRGGGGHVRAAGYESDLDPEAEAAALRGALEALAVAASR